jgi:hypothetical protein
MEHSRTLPLPTVSPLLVVVAALLVGCNSEREAEVAMRRQCLTRLNQVYLEYRSERKESPADLQSFTAFIDETANADDKVAGELKTRLADLDIVVFWNAKLADDGSSDNDHVLAFEASCPGNGGYMVTVGGIVDHVTAKTFGAMTEVEHE